MKKVLITGAAGFVGFNVFKELYYRNIEIIAVIRKKEKNINKFKKYNVKVIECDLRNIASLENKLINEKIDTIYHFAWQGVSGKERQDDEIQLMNLHATLELIDVAHKLKITTFIGAGSIHELEIINEMTQNKIINNRSLMYKSAKLSAHYMGKTKAGNLGIRFFWPIITNTYGAGEKSERLISSIIRKMLNGESIELSSGEQLYDFIYIDDLAKAFYLIGEKGVDGNNYVIGTGHPIPLYNYLKQIEIYVNKVNYPHKYVKLDFGKIVENVIALPKNAFDTNLLTEDTEFIPEISFEEGIRRTIEWEKNSN